MNKRQLRFRAWDVKNKEWLFDFRLHPHGRVMQADKSTPTKFHHYETSTAQLKNILLSEWTGLYDSDNIPIYEGDVVTMKAGRSYNETRLVEFRDGAFRFNNQKTLGAGFIYVNENTHVIGNVYENPNLIKHLTHPI